jgi:hypothetical protein
MGFQIPNPDSNELDFTFVGRARQPVIDYVRDQCWKIAEASNMWKDISWESLGVLFEFLRIGTHQLLIAFALLLTLRVSSTEAITHTYTTDDLISLESTYRRSRGGRS